MTNENAYMANQFSYQPGAPYGILAPLNVSSPGILGGLQTIGTTGAVGGPPQIVGLLTPEPLPPEATDQDLMMALTISNEAINRVLARMPGYHQDAFIKGKGWQILDDMKTHSAYNSPIRLKKYAALYKQRETLPRVNGQVVKDDHPRYDRANEIADFCRYALDNIMSEVTYTKQDFREVAWYYLDAIHSGNSTLEVVWTKPLQSGPYKGKKIFAQFIPRVPKQITYNLDPFTTEVVSINNYTAMGWQTYLPLFRKFWRYTYQGEAGLPWGRGDARACYKHVFALNELTRLWGVALQKHGSGFLHAKVENPQADYVAGVIEQLDKASSTAVIVDPPGVETDILNLPGGALDAFVHPITYNAQMIAREILGQDLTTGHGDGKGSYALGDIHQGTEEFFRAHPRKDLEDGVKTLYHWLIYTNYGEQDLDCMPEHSQGVWNLEEINMLADFYGKLTNLGYMRPDFEQDMERVRRTVGLPEMPTLAEENPDSPYLLPNHEQVLIQMPSGRTYQGTAIDKTAPSANKPTAPISGPQAKQ